jgi:hypothetical protein
MRATTYFYRLIDVILPAVRGVTGLLKSALRYGYAHHLLDLLFFTYGREKIKDSKNSFD